MPKPSAFDEAATEAFLSGRAAGANFPVGMASFAEDVWIAISGHVPAPKPNLARLLAEGLVTDNGVLPATAARDAIGSAPQTARLPSRRKERGLVLAHIGGLSAKLAALGLAAKVGLGIGVAAASVTGASAAGVLPAPLQHVVATAVESVTPFHFPDPVESRSAIGTEAPDPTGISGGPVGVDGPTVADGAKNQVPANEAPSPGSPGSNGLDQANTTPAAGHAPTSVPAPTPGSVATGLDQANTTPAAGHAPMSVPVPAGSRPSDSSGGTSTSNSTPGAGQKPALPPGANANRP